MMQLTFAITGANGQVGQFLTQYLREKGHIVLELVRAPEKATNKSHYLFFDLAKPEAMPALNGIDILIHAAHYFDVSDIACYQKINIDGSRALLQKVKQYRVSYCIFISTISSFENARSLYGKTKFKIEQLFQSQGIVLRPGLIFQEPLQGIVGAIQSIVRKHRIIPLIGFGKQRLYLCPIKLLGEEIYAAAISRVRTTKPVVIANKNSISLKQLVQQFSIEEKKSIFCIPIPYFFIYFGLRFFETCGLSIGFRSDSLIGLQHANATIDDSAIH